MCVTPTSRLFIESELASQQDSDGDSDGSGGGCGAATPDRDIAYFGIWLAEYRVSAY